MTREEKSQAIEELKDVLAGTDTVYLTDIAGLNAESTSDLRRTCFKSEVSLKVVKNTLLKKAMETVEGKEYDELFGSLKGNTTIMIAEKGNAPAKVIKEFKKKSELIKFKAAWIDSAAFVGEEHLDALSKLKSKEELIGDVITLLQSPMKNVVSALSSGGQTISGLVKTLSEREEQ